MTVGISVVLCTYNGEKYIEEQLRSVLEQTLAPLEVVVSDDGSTDRTLEIVGDVAGRSAVPIRMHRNSERLGFADNFLRASESVKGNLIAFCDQDDVWFPEKLQTQADALHRTGAAMAAHDVWEIGSDGERRAPARPRTERRERVVTDRTGAPWGNYLGNTLVFRRDLLSRMPVEARGTDPFTLGSPLSHDRWLYFLASIFGGIVILPQKLSAYRLHDRQLYGIDAERSVRDRLRAKRLSGRTQALALAAIADHRVQLLEQYIEPEAERSRSVSRWSGVARRYRRGASLYDHALPVRVGQVGVSALHGDYLPLRSGGLGWRRLLQDGALALFAGRDAAGTATGSRPR